MGVVVSGGDASDSTELSCSGDDDDDDEEEEEEEEEVKPCASSTRVVDSTLSSDITSGIGVVTAFPTPVVVSS